jgi:hypothetical protein
MVSASRLIGFAELALENLWTQRQVLVMRFTLVNIPLGPTGEVIALLFR